ncbi:DUF4159 domain-containing protein [Phreatobacter aquaticus]|uniref:DUF4159 domain-containing protein n=1 Tax=Phreatobacter aquaticus TaxID=2570229 RepID=A0A4D7QNF7_9HYPH|nr:DUF4159 domain-containing protein [Phreatobacter aquaticus]QCK88915.1 DUF4159 domain-containing protein [Phreatobacter aquaticus]
MLGLPLAFASPLVLFALAALPALWWLLRLVPPRPRRVQFPPTRILMEIAPKEETPSNSPWWLTLLRLLLAAIIILAMAGPLWNPPATTSGGRGPVLLLVDDGWASAASFEQRLRVATQIVASAESAGRPVAFATTARPVIDIGIETPSSVRERLRSLDPLPHTPDRAQILPALTKFLAAQPLAEIVWLADGIDTGRSEAFITQLKDVVAGRTLSVFDGGTAPVLALTNAANSNQGFTVAVIRADAGPAQAGRVRALDSRGLPLGESTFAFEPGKTEAEAKFDLPVEIRNEITRLDVIGERSAGAVQLIDARWQRRTIGVISGASSDTAQPLLSPTYYLGRALEPFADIRTVEGASPSEAAMRFVEGRVPMIVLTDVGTVTPQAREALSRFLDNGGILLRFAGTRLAGAQNDDLVPVRLRRGGRQLGGTLSWETPQGLAPFTRESPFADIAVPADVRVRRQVLAEPDGLLADKTWAQLADGTPLVTAEKRGRGMLILFHITADTAWSDLPLSGAFVEMLKRVAGLSAAGRPAAEGLAALPGQVRGADRIAPTRVLDGFGAFIRPPATAKPIPADWRDAASYDFPPGFYGPQEGMVAVNTLTPAERLKPLDLRPLAATIERYRVGEPVDLRSPLVIAALLLLLLDGLAVFAIAGGLARLTARRPARAAVVLALALVPLLLSAPADAQTRRSQDRPPPISTGNPADDAALRATQATRLAYVVTGSREVDEVSRAGLEGLTRFLSARTALEPAAPQSVDISRDEIAFFPVIYWPIVSGAAEPSPQALLKLDAYMKQGGMVIFDTRDALTATPGQASPAQATLRRIIAGLDIPELEPVPRDHVLARAFFILREFPGRYADGGTWVEAIPPATDEEAARPARASDSVSPVIITSNDLASAWAIDRQGNPLLPVQGEARQRELAFRFGVNIVMYALTGNYKTDQVHVPALLERLGN